MASEEKYAMLSRREVKGPFSVLHIGDLVYVAGPYRGKNSWDVELNIRSAEVTGMAIAELGLVPVIPHTMYRFWDGTLNDQFWLQCGIKLLNVCNAIVLCKGWRDSAGSIAEKEHAQRMGIFVYEGVESDGE